MRVGNLVGRLNVFTDSGAVDVERVSDGRFGPDPQSVYAVWDEFVKWAADGISDADAVPFVFDDLGAPAPRPAQIFAIGLNYHEHAGESGLRLPESPMVFTKFASSLAGPVGDVVLAGDTVDWEVELVAVIGRHARNVPIDRGWDYIAGLTAGQDISERTIQLKDPVPQISLGKSLPGFSPTGPWLVTPNEFDNRDDLGVACMVNGYTTQKDRTSNLIFSVPFLVSYLSRYLPLGPGDIIFTGSPGGVGMKRTPPVYLADGDELVSTIEGVGELRHRFIGAEKA